MKNTNDVHSEPDRALDVHASHNAMASRSRRALLKGGLAAAPVTLVSRPILASTTCAAPSAFLSAGSRVVQVQCSGVDASYWLANKDSWPAPFVAAREPLPAVDVAANEPIASVPTNDHTTRRGATENATLLPDANGGAAGTLFHSSETGFQGPMLANKSLTDVLQGPDSGLPGLAKYCTVALLNAASGRTPVLSESDVRDLWNELVGRGYYEPTAGVKWSEDDIIQYIASTIG